MTVETKTTIEPDDLMTVEFVCKGCNAVRSFPIGKFLGPPLRCECRDENWMTHSGDIYQSICRLVGLIERMAQAKNEPFVLRFGVRGVSVSDHVSRAKD